MAVKFAALVSLGFGVVVSLYILWFKFSFGAKFFKLVQFLFAFVVYSLP